jgi:Ca-activated chloride channel family protein
MSSPDFQPDNRLEAAKNVLAEFIRNREFDRIGLVVFARDAFIHVPLTLDYDVLLGLIDEVRLAPQLGLLDGTAIGMGLASAGNMVRGTDTLSKVVVLLTDGANNAGAIDPITAADALSALDIKVYTVGMGKPEAVASIEGSELDEDALQTIAALTGGFFFRAESTSSLQLVYEQIDGLERSPVERQLFVRWQDQVVGWLTAALLLLVGERIMRHTVFQTIP